MQPVAACRRSPFVHKPATVKLVLLIYGFKFRCASVLSMCRLRVTTTTTPSD